MRKQFLSIGIFIVSIISVAFLLHAGSSSVTGKNNSSKDCSKTCQKKPAPAPRTGFFIFDSFSGSL